MKIKQLAFANMLLLLVCALKNDWIFQKSQFRLEIVVDTGDFERVNRPVEVELDLAKFFVNADHEFQLQKDSLHLVELDKKNRQLRVIAPLQLDLDESNSQIGNLTFILPGTISAHTIKRFHLYFGEPNKAVSNVKTLVSIEDNVEHEEQASFKVTTPTSTYYYHKFGAGFASIEDKDGNDWLSYNPGVGPESNSGSGGVYRGLPNMGYPEGYCHPGKEVSNSWIVNDGPVKVSIFSESNDKNMQCLWDIFPAFARLTVIKLRTPYWFLYEGTPGGLLEENSDFNVRVGNIKRLCYEKWDGDIDAHGEIGEWLYYSDGEMNRSIYLIQNLDDDKTDSYWPMNEEMTVFGFGRLGLEKYMERQNNQFTIGLAETKNYDEMKRIIDSAYQPMNVKIGNIVVKP